MSGVGPAARNAVQCTWVPPPASGRSLEAFSAVKTNVAGGAVENVIELEVGEGRQEGTYAVRVVRSLAGGEPVGTLTLDLEELLAQRTLIEATVLSSAVPTRRLTSVAEQPIRVMGQKLFESMFKGPVAGAYRASLGVARERETGLQVVLRLTAPGLAALPWETLYDPEIGSYVCRKEPLVRHVAAPFTAELLAVQSPLRILGMVASPRGLPALDVRAEQARLHDALRHHIDAGRVELVWLDDVSWAGLHDALLEESWHMMHFIGHGGYDAQTDEGVLALVGLDGLADYVGASSLADLLDEAEPTPRLVVLNSCASGATGVEDLFSGTAAALVRSGIHAVAAMQFAVSDGAAIAFARGLYTAIASGRAVDTAVRSGRIAILGTSRNTLEWVTPVLYLRGASTPLFAIAESPAAEHPGISSRRPGTATGQAHGDRLESAPPTATCDPAFGPAVRSRSDHSAKSAPAVDQPRGGCPCGCRSGDSHCRVRIQRAWSQRRRGFQHWWRFVESRISATHRGDCYPRHSGVDQNRRQVSSGRHPRDRDFRDRDA